MPEQEEADTQSPAGEQSSNQDAQPEDQLAVVQPVEVASPETTEPDGDQPVEVGSDTDQPDGDRLVDLPVEVASPESDQPDGDQLVQVGSDIDLPETTQPDPVPPLLIAAHATAAGSPAGDAPPEPREPQPPAIEPRRLSRAERETVDRQQRRFAACGRCGYFVADCRIYLGQETFHDAILASRDGWVRMEGDRRFHRLVMDAFGVQLDAAFDSFNGTCPECRRSFEVVNSDEGPTRVKIRV